MWVNIPYIHMNDMGYINPNQTIPPKKTATESLSEDDELTTSDSDSVFARMSREWEPDTLKLTAKHKRFMFQPLI